MAKNMYDSEAQVLWQDRKRWCGLPWSFTRYSVIRKDGQYAKLVNINGFLSSHSEEVNLYRVDDFEVHQSLTDKMFGVGTVTVYCKDATCDKIELKNVKNPYKVRQLLNKLVLEDRQRVGLRQTEMQF
jgi:hypothetical protein